MNTAINTNTARGRLTLTVCISTCYGDISIFPTIESIRASRDVVIDRLILIADRTPIPAASQARLKNLGVEFVWNEKEGSLPSKIAQALAMCDTDIFVTTQDDVIFEPTAIAGIERAFRDPAVTMVSSVIQPVPAASMRGSLMDSIIRVPGRIARAWNGGDNYLSSSGRCQSFRTRFMKKMRLPELVNFDAFVYFENKRLGGRMAVAWDSVVRIRPPQTMREQLRPSSRYQNSRLEVLPAFDTDIATEYVIPAGALVGGFLGELVRYPLAALMYVAVYAYTRLFRLAPSKVLKTSWSADASTKQASAK